MLRLTTLRQRLAAGLLALTAATTGLSAPSASACDIKVCTYKKVVCYEDRVVTTCEYKTLYDECGEAYTVKVKRQKTVQVPVTKLVKVCY